MPYFPYIDNIINVPENGAFTIPWVEQGTFWRDCPFRCGNCHVSQLVGFVSQYLGPVLANTGTRAIRAV